VPTTVFQTLKTTTTTLLAVLSTGMKNMITLRAKLYKDTLLAQIRLLRIQNRSANGTVLQNTSNPITRFFARTQPSLNRRKPLRDPPTLPQQTEASKTRLTQLRLRHRHKHKEDGTTQHYLTAHTLTEFLQIQYPTQDDTDIDPSDTIMALCEREHPNL
jgi:hypothetical protein